MASPIDSLMFDAGPDIYYTEEFNRVLEDHMTYLRTSASTTKMPVEPIDLERYQADLYGLFQKLNIPPFMFRAVMRTTDLKSPNIVPRELEFLLVPDQVFIQQLAQTVNTVNRIK
mgnify:CR=1 FL=1